MTTMDRRLVRALVAISTMAAFQSRAADPAAIPPAPRPASAAVREISIDETDKLIRERQEVAIVDVRTAQEFNEQGHLPRAQLVDFFREDFTAALGTLHLDPAKPCIVYCAIGGRAKRAAEKMAQLGFKEILLPKGSFKAWKVAGKPVEGGATKTK